MDINKIPILLILFIIFASCENTGEWKNKYVETLNSYPSILTSHFPQKDSLKQDFFSQIFYPSEFSPLLYYIKQTESDTTIDSLISDSSKIPYSDSSFYIVNKHLRKDNTLSMPQSYDSFEAQDFEKNAVPIPNFYKSSDFKEENYHYLNDSYSIYIVEASSEKCCEEELHRGDWHMPNQWKDGYTKGYAINEKENEVIYWYVIW